MTNLQDLRDTLQARSAIDDRDGATRAAAIHDRVRNARRRRRGAVAGAAAAVLVATLVALNLPSERGPGPAGGGDLVGPKTITSTGYTYERGATTTGKGKVKLRIPKSDQPQLVAWGTEDGAADALRVRAPGEDAFTSAAGAFDDYYLVSPGNSGNLSVSGADGRVAVSTYTLSDVAPEGVTVEGITYRKEVASRTLRSAVIGELGATELELTLPAVDVPVQISTLCAGIDGEFRLNISVPGGGYIQSGCADSTFDPGAFWSVGLDDLKGATGEPVTVRIWLSRRGGGDTPIEPGPQTAGVRLGLGIYTEDPAYESGESDAPALLEWQGHTWELSQGVEGSGASPVVVDLDGDGPLLARVDYTSKGGLEYAYSAMVGSSRRDLSASSSYGRGKGATGPFRIPLDADSFTVEPARGGKLDVETTVSIYRQVD